MQTLKVTFFKALNVQSKTRSVLFNYEAIPALLTSITELMPLMSFLLVFVTLRGRLLPSIRMVFLCRFSFFSLELSTQKTPGLVTKVGGRFIHIRIVMDGERDRIRTCDPVIKSHLLYQLSYAPD